MTGPSAGRGPRANDGQSARGFAAPAVVRLTCRPMSVLSEILTFNKDFVSSKEYEKFETDRFPNKKLVILTCMDTRLTELLPQAMNFRNGDIKLIKNAGAIVSHPFGSVMRSILV